MKNPFADKNHQIDYGLLGKDINVDHIKDHTVFPKKFATHLQSLVDNMQKTQFDWVAHWNKENAVMFDNRHFYDLADRLGPSARERAEAILNHPDNSGNVPLSLGSSIRYTGEDVGCIHHAVGSTVAPSVVSDELVIPYLHNTSLIDVLANDEGLKFLKEFFATNDNKKKITERLAYLTRKDPHKIKFSTNEPIVRCVDEVMASKYYEFPSEATAKFDIRWKGDSSESKGYSLGLIFNRFNSRGGRLW